MNKHANFAKKLILFRVKRSFCMSTLVRLSNAFFPPWQIYEITSL